MEENRVYTEMKVVFARESLTFARACEILNDRLGASYNTSKLSQKLTNGSMKFNEFAEIMDVLGYDIIVSKREL